MPFSSWGGQQLCRGKDLPISVVTAQIEDYTCRSGLWSGDLLAVYHACVQVSMQVECVFLWKPAP